MTTSPSSRPFTGKHMLLIMVGFFGVIIGVNFTMAYMASNSWTGLVVKNSYVASQQYNAKLKAAETQKALGFRSEISYRENALEFVLKDGNNQPVALENATLKVGRPAYEQADQTLDFPHISGASNRINLPLATGLWVLTISGETSGNAYRRDVRLYVNEKNEGAVE